MITENFKIFGKKKRFCIKRIKENRMVIYEDKPFTFKTSEEAVAVACALKTNDKHTIVGMGYYFYKIK